MADVFETRDFRNGLKVELDGEPWMITDFQHVKPGKGNAFTRTRLKNLITGKVLDRTFKSGETLTKPELDARDMQYLYNDGETYSFMDTSNYEQVALQKETLGELAQWLKDQTVVGVLFYQGRAISVDLPTFVELQISHTEPGIKGDTATGAVKPATLETGATVNVPLFLNEGDVIKIDTRTGDYVERVNK
jgi:elongation factor P